MATLTKPAADEPEVAREYRFVGLVLVPVGKTEGPPQILKGVAAAVVLPDVLSPIMAPKIDSILPEEVGLYIPTSGVPPAPPVKAVAAAPLTLSMYTLPRITASK